MKKTNISYLKANLSACMQQVKEGEEYLVLDRKKPVGILKPYSGGLDQERDQRITDGIIRPGKGPVQVKDLPPPVKVSGPPLSVLLDEEREER